MKKLLRLPLKIAVLPILVGIFILQMVGAILVGLSSIVTNLLATIFIAGSVIGFAVSAPSAMVWQVVGLGIFFALAPHLAAWLLDKLSSLMVTVLDFLLS